MTLLEVAREARARYLRGANHFAGMLMPIDLALAAAAGDWMLADALTMLWDLSTPSGDLGSFSGFVDGAEYSENGDALGVVYKYDRAKSEIAAVLGRACLLAQGFEDGTVQPPAVWLEAEQMRHRGTAA